MVHLRARSLAVLMFVIVPLGGAGASEPSFDCDSAQTEAEAVVCSDDALGAIDRRLAARFAAAMEAAGGLDAGASAAVDELRAMQRGWLKGRDACWKADDQRACVERAYLRREGELVAMWMLEPPSQTITYRCGPQMRAEVTAMFFDTELPSVRLEFGDTVDAGSLVPSGSGARYEASFGRSLWTRGEDTAALTWPEGETFACQAQ